MFMQITLTDSSRLQDSLIVVARGILSKVLCGLLTGFLVIKDYARVVLSAEVEGLQDSILICCVIQIIWLEVLQKIFMSVLRFCSIGRNQPRAIRAVVDSLEE